MSYGIFGLIDAIEKYDLERGIKFETYAISRIKGAIIDELRAIDWIPRSVRFKAREVEKAYVALENRLHRSPTDAEVAQQLGITTDELHQIFTRSRSCRWSPLTSCSRSALSAATGSAWSTPWRTRAPRTRWRCSSPRR